MFVRRVGLTNVRSRTYLEIDLSPGVNVLVGPNGVGKTTVLEGIALALQGAALRGSSVKDLISHGADFLRVEVALESASGSIVTAAAAHDRAGGRRLTADGAELEDASRWQELVSLSTFVPDDLRLIKGSPRRRREYLDRLVARVDPAYRSMLRQYEEALAQRNMLLRSRVTAGSQFAPWERLLAETGVAITRRRAERLKAFVAGFQSMHGELTGANPDSIRLVYRSNAADLSLDAYVSRLAEMREADRQRTFTHLGPHRDDLRLLREGLDMRDYASQGEQRAALLTLVLAEWAQAYEDGPGPLLLLDDVMSELDEQRRQALMSTVGSKGQTIISTTDLRYFSAAETATANVVALGPEISEDQRA